MKNSLSKLEDLFIRVLGIIVVGGGVVFIVWMYGVALSASARPITYGLLTIVIIAVAYAINQYYLNSSVKQYMRGVKFITDNKIGDKYTIEEINNAQMIFDMYNDPAFKKRMAEVNTLAEEVLGKERLEEIFNSASQKLQNK